METEFLLPLSDIAGALGESSPMQDNETRFWSKGQHTEAPEDLETPDLSRFYPVLQVVKNPHEEFKAEYFGILDDHIGETLNDLKDFT